MKRVFQSADYYSAQLFKSYLEDHAIEAIVTGELLIGAIGEIPANSYPAVWVVDNDDLDRAKQLLTAFENRSVELSQQETAWICPQCHESIEAQFTQCWHCGAIKPG
ncbi:MAG: DUF2007 domain-containing protein [Gammaproteobacteria bacterium]|nr:DUF2007 domain-containing protein [Gammaproteobacteria bacterium]